MSVLLLLLGGLGTIAVVIGVTLGSILGRAFGKVLSSELEAAIPELAKGMLQKAIERLPEESRERFAEEWAAGLKVPLEKQPLVALAQAISLYQRARRIAAELEPSTVSVQGEAGDGRPPRRFGGVRGLPRVRFGFSPKRAWWAAMDIARLYAIFSGVSPDEMVLRTARTLAIVLGLAGLLLVVLIGYFGLRLLGFA